MQVNPFRCGPNPCLWYCREDEPTPEACLITAGVDAPTWTVISGSLTGLVTSANYEAIDTVEPWGTYRQASAFLTLPPGACDLQLGLCGGYYALRLSCGASDDLLTCELLVDGVVARSTAMAYPAAPGMSLTVNLQTVADGTVEASGSDVSAIGFRMRTTGPVRTGTAKVIDVVGGVTWGSYSTSVAHGPDTGLLECGLDVACQFGRWPDATYGLPWWATVSGTPALAASFLQLVEGEAVRAMGVGDVGHRYTWFDCYLRKNDTLSGWREFEVRPSASDLAVSDGPFVRLRNSSISSELQVGVGTSVEYSVTGGAITVDPTVEVCLVGDYISAKVIAQSQSLTIQETLSANPGGEYLGLRSNLLGHLVQSVRYFSADDPDYLPALVEGTPCNACDGAPAGGSMNDNEHGNQSRCRASGCKYFRFGRCFSLNLSPLDRGCRSVYKLMQICPDGLWP